MHPLLAQACSAPGGIPEFAKFIGVNLDPAFRTTRQVIWHLQRIGTSNTGQSSSMAGRAAAEPSGEDVGGEATHTEPEGREEQVAAEVNARGGCQAGKGRSEQGSADGAGHPAQKNESKAGDVHQSTTIHPVASR